MQYNRSLLTLMLGLALSAPPFIPAVAADSVPPLSLANNYHRQIDLNRYWVSEKYDGARVWWNGQQLISRGGNVYHAPGWFIDKLPRQTLDGELWMGRGNFQLLMQTIRDHRPDDTAWRQVRFMVFDAPDVAGDFDRRQLKLAELIGSLKLSWVELVPQYRVATHQALQEMLAQRVAQGAEGLMLRRRDSHYLAGRHSGLLKLKLHSDAEARVIRYLPGKGKYRHMMGSLLVEDSGGLQFRLGSGFTDAQRREPPPLGAWVSYRYQGRTRSGKPRFARFLRIRPAE